MIDRVPGATSRPQILDLPLVGAQDIRDAEDATSRLLGTSSDVLLLQAEAIVALEATAKGIGRPGLRALNVVTGPYGALFGRWLTSAGADVVGLRTSFDRTATAGQVEDILSSGHVDLVALVHAEAATGGANPVAEISVAARRAGALFVVDAVASVGAHAVVPDDWHADVVVVGAQKALAGPAGVSALSISGRAWEAIEQNADAPRESILSLLDLRDGWLQKGRTTLGGTPSSLETSAYLQALARVEAEGLDSVIDRHRAAAAAARAGLPALGLSPWISDGAAAAGVVTTFAPPADVTVAELLTLAAGAPTLGHAPGPLAGTTLRINHTGQAARLDLVQRDLSALGRALGRDPDQALAAAAESWAATISR